MKQASMVGQLMSSCGRWVFPSLFGFLLTGCVAMKSYVDPQYRSATYMNLAPAKEPKPVVVDVSFQMNGKEDKRLRQLARSRVTKVLRGSRLFYEPDTQNIQAGKLNIVINNVGNIGAAVGKGIATGLTLGLVGSEVVDGYEMRAVYTPAEGSPLTKNYKHAIHSIVGLHSAPAGMEPVAIQVAFEQVVEDMLLNFLRDLQRENAL